MELLVWGLPVSGATLIITCSTLFQAFREFWMGKVQKLYELLVCPMCTGFWVAALGTFLGHTLAQDANIFIAAFKNGCAGALLCWAVHVALCHYGQGRLLSARADIRGATAWRNEALKHQRSLANIDDALQKYDAYGDIVAASDFIEKARKELEL